MMLYKHMHFKSPCLVTLLLVVLVLTGCSHSSLSKGSNSSFSQQQSNDRLERFNRHVYKFNASLDKHILKPIAVTYKKVTPEVVDTGVTNFFQNLGDISNAVNNLLQFKAGDALIDTERFIFNTSFGLGGIFDVATEMGLDKHNEDFGQTLAVWGVKSGPYVMLPILGPSTIRDATANLTVDNILNPVNYSEHPLPLIVISGIDKRTDLLLAEDAFKDFSNEEYSAIRDAWLQRREYLIRDGKIDQKAQSDLIDELEELEDE